MATKTAQECENLSASSVARLIASWGDSLTASTGGQTPYPSQAAALFAPDRAVANKGVGGETSTQIRTRFFSETGLRGRTQWIWAGRNNYTDPEIVKADVAVMAAAATSGRYLVGSIINGNYANEYSGQSNHIIIAQLNADLASIYGERFVDVRTPLVATGAPGGAYENATDFGHDIPPAGIRTDNIHLISAGYAIVAQAFYDRHVALGW